MNAAVPHNRCPTGLLQGPIASSQPLAVPSNVDLRLLFVMQDYAQQGAMDPDMAIVVDETKLTSLFMNSPGQRPCCPALP